MANYNFLSKLVDLKADGSPFLSIYLDTGPNENGQKNFDVFLKKQLNDHAAVIDPSSEERKRFDAVAEHIWQFANGIDPSTRGAAIFASTGPSEFFQTLEFQVPIETNEFFSLEKPHIYPLMRIFGQHPTFVVAAADTNSARIFTYRRGRILEKEEIQNLKTSRSEAGGWSQMRFQRHLENFHEQHAKEVVAELDKLVRSERIDAVVLVGDEAVIIPMLMEEMSKELSEKVVAKLALNIDTPEKAMLEQADTAMREYDAAADAEKIDHLMEQNYEDGVGVTGVDNVLRALLNGQVQELYLTADPNDITYDNTAVEDVLRKYEPALEDLPDVNDKALLIDELIARAAATADSIRFIEDPHLLKTSGGVGAILRYQAKGVSNT